MKFSVLIVDDEFYICEGIKTKLEHLAFPEIQDIRVCYSGEEALALCEDFRPSIVLTDIKMEGMNGINLIHELKKKLHPVRFLVLSGYDNYEYVRNSFQEGAADYLLKPIITEQLKNIIAEQLQLLKNQMTPSADSRSLSVQLAEQLFHDLSAPLHPEASPGSNISLPNPLCRLVCMAWRGRHSLIPADFLDRIYKHYSHTPETLVLACAVSSEKICILLNTSVPEQSPVEFWKDMIHAAAADFSLEAAVGISAQGPVGKIQVLYYEAENHLARRILEGYGKVYQGNFFPAAKELPPKPRQLTHQILNKPELLKDGNLWGKLSEQLRLLTLPELKRYYNYFSGACLSFTSNQSAGDSPIKFESFYNFSSYEHLEKYICSKFKECVSCTLHSPKNNIEYIKQYVDEHYTEPLSMSEVADRFFISYSHLSRMFHDKIGMSFQEYLISKRMAYASQLLMAPELSVQEAASMAGYDNVFNFSRAFKKHFGMSPNHYRNL